VRRISPDSLRGWTGRQSAPPNLKTHAHVASRRDNRILPKGTRTTTLERQLKHSQAVVDQVKADLVGQGVGESDLKTQPKYRHAFSDLRAVKRRLAAVTAKEAIAAGAGVHETGDDAGSEEQPKNKKNKKNKKNRK